MLTLSPGSVCDVCAEEYGPHCLPHSIPCGHVLCSGCCNTIVEKTSPRLTPVCPFCREQFTSDTVRLIRIDFPSNARAAPRRRGVPIEAHDQSSDFGARKEERFLLMEASCSRVRAEARRLEDKVAKVAAKKCSVEEVTTLHKELQEWLTSEVKSDDQLSSLSLSAALLRAILMNHFAHSEATKMAKTTEANLKAKLDDAEMEVSKLEAEVSKQRTLYTQKVQECQSLRAEISRFNLKSTVAAHLPARPSSAAPMMAGERRQSISSASTASLYGANNQSPLSRLNPVHMRSASASMSRPTTPAIRPHTPATVRPETPVSPLYRATSPPPPLPSKPRTYSISSHVSPQKMTRSYSDEKEKEKTHERWLPSVDIAYSPPSSKSMNYSLP
ncbi:hypothetical protein SERLADRAFT_478524, partial [Serpula lacrymans var. lacrymans S7.9]